MIVATADVVVVAAVAAAAAAIYTHAMGKKRGKNDGHTQSAESFAVPVQRVGDWRAKPNILAKSTCGNYVNCPLSQFVTIEAIFSLLSLPGFSNDNSLFF